MKKTLALFCALLILCTGLLTACKPNQSTTDTTTPSTAQSDVEKEIITQASVFTSGDSKKINKLFYGDENIAVCDSPLWELESLATYEGVGINTLCDFLKKLTIEVEDVTDTEAVYKITAPDMSTFFDANSEAIINTKEDCEITGLINSFAEKAAKKAFDVTLTYSVNEKNTVIVNYQTKAFTDAITGGLVSRYEFNYEPKLNAALADNRNYPVKDAFAQTTPNNNKSIRYRIPEIQIDKSNIATLNKDIFDKYSDIIANSNPEHNDENVTLVGYEWGCRGDVLTVIITTEIDYTHRTYEVYYLSLSSGNALTRSDLLSAANITEEQYKQNVCDASESAFWESLELDSNTTDNEDFANLINSTLDTMRADTTMAKESVPYLNRTGELWAVTRVYSIAGADKYIRKLNVENFTPSEFLGLKIECK